MSGITGDLEGADGLTFSRKFSKGLHDRGFSKEERTVLSPTSPSVFIVAAAPGPPEATLCVLEWNNRIRAMRRINLLLIIPD